MMESRDQQRCSKSPVAGGVTVFGAPESWKASEEVALLEAVELYGFGNWEDTACFVGKIRSVQEVRDHFVALYVNGNIGRVTWSSVDPEAFKVTDHTTPAPGQLSPSLTTPLQSISELSLSEQQHLGYMPKRDDFEREFDNDVESLISTLRINPNEEDDLDVDLKVAHIDMYNRRLKERFRKKAVVRDYDLVSLFYKSLSNDDELMSILHPQLSTEGTPAKHHQTSCSISSSANASPSSSSSLGSPSRNTLMSINDHHASSSRVSSPHSILGSPSSSSVTSGGIPSPKNSGDRTHASHSMQSPSSSLKNNHVKPTSVNNASNSPHVKQCNTTNGSKKKCLSPGRKSSNTISSQPSHPSSPCPLSKPRVIDKQREILSEKFKIFSQFQSALDKKQLFDNLKREKELKTRIKELWRFRRNGLKSLLEVSSYESARSRRDKKKENKKKFSGNDDPDVDRKNRKPDSKRGKKRKYILRSTAKKSKKCSVSKKAVVRNGRKAGPATNGVRKQQKRAENGFSRVDTQQKPRKKPEKINGTSAGPVILNSPLKNLKNGQHKKSSNHVITSNGISEKQSKKCSNRDLESLGPLRAPRRRRLNITGSR